MISVKHSGMAALLISGLFTAQSALASEWGCEVLLCLSNPGGPTEFAQCVAPINRLYDTLKDGGSFPTCEEAGPNTQIRRGYEEYVPCSESYPPNPEAVDRNKKPTPDSVGYTVSEKRDREKGNKYDLYCRTPVQFKISRDEYVYYYKPAVRRTKPNWIQIFVDSKPIHKNWY